MNTQHKLQRFIRRRAKRHSGTMGITVGAKGRHGDKTALMWKKAYRTLKYLRRMNPGHQYIARDIATIQDNPQGAMWSRYLIRIQRVEVAEVVDLTTRSFCKYCGRVICKCDLNRTFVGEIQEGGEE